MFGVTPFNLKQKFYRLPYLTVAVDYIFYCR